MHVHKNPLSGNPGQIRPCVSNGISGLILVPVFINLCMRATKALTLLADVIQFSSTQMLSWLWADPYIATWNICVDTSKRVFGDKLGGDKRFV